MQINTINDVGFFLLRSPRYSISDLELFNSMIKDANQEKLEVEFKKILKNNSFREAMLLASPSFLQECERWMRGDITEARSIKKIITSIYKYYIRICTRSTPFGMFAGCAMGSIKDNTEILREPLENDQNNLRIDSGIVDEITRKVNQLPGIYLKLKYFSNSTIYPVSNFLRYAEISTNAEGQKHYSLNQIENNEIITKILKISEKGTTLSTLQEFLVNEGFSKSTGRKFLKSLIAAQVIVNELQVGTVGKELSIQIIEKISQLSQPINKILIKIKNACDNFSEKKYHNSIKYLKKIVPDSNQKNLFQSDLFIATSKNTISSLTVDKIKTQISSLNCLLTRTTSSQLDEFVKAFNRQYEDQEVPLCLALDPDYGIGYGENYVVDDKPIHFLNLENKAPGIKYEFTELDQLIYDKYMDSLKNGSHTITLAETDINNLSKESRDKLYPESFYLQGKLIKNSTETPDDFQFLITSSFGPSGARTFTRFCYGIPNLKNSIQEFISKEEKIHPEIIFAEINHLPQPKVGNILQRPSFRKYEINLFCNPSLNEIKSIPISDLMISIKNKAILLRSKTLNKYILPRLTSAHNFSNGMSVYRFLCDLQYYDQYNLNPWDWKLFKTSPFLPRIEYNNLIITRASWLLSSEHFGRNFPTYEKFITEVTKYFAQNKIPSQFVIVEGDNELLLDISNEISIQLLYSELKKKSRFRVFEHLESSKNCYISDSKNKRYTGEVCFPLLNRSSPAINNVDYFSRFLNLGNNSIANTRRHFMPGDEWLYIKIYGANTVLERILLEELNHFITLHEQKGYIKQWFFIRYNDPEFHIRLRILPSEEKHKAKLQTLFNNLFRGHIEEMQIRSIQWDTYVRELERYGPKTIKICEKIFHIDSQYILNVLPQINHPENKWLLGLLGVAQILEVINLPNSVRATLLNDLASAFLIEHGNSDKLRRSLKEHYRNNLQEIRTILEKDSGRTGIANNLIIHLENRGDYLKNYWTDLKNTTDLSVEQEIGIVSSFMHMHLNRLFSSNARNHELIIYDHLNMYYKSMDARIQKLNNV